VARLQPGATALLVHPGQSASDGKPAPVLAVGNFGKGRTLALLTDSAWNWGFAAADDGRGRSARARRSCESDGRRWASVCSASGKRDSLVGARPCADLLHIDLDRTEYRRGQTVAARVRTLHADYSPAGRIAVTLDLLPAEDASGGAGAAAKTLRALTVTTGEDGEAHAELAGLAAGAYRLIGRATLDGRAVEEQTTFVLRPEGRELDECGEPRRSAAPDRRGHWREFRVGTLGTPSIRPARQVRVGSLRTVAIWSHPSLLFSRCPARQRVDASSPRRPWIEPTRPADGQVLRIFTDTVTRWYRERQADRDFV